MKVDSQIICRREPYGVVCQWEGDERHGTATVDGHSLSRALHSKSIPRGVPVKFGTLRLLVLGIVFGTNGMGSDLYYVKLDNPHSQLYWFYRERAERFLRFIVRLEAAIRVFKGLPIEGEVMPFTAWLASKML